MPDPKHVFDDPQSFWAMLTSASDADLESQHFDRKALGRPEGGAVTGAQVSRLRDVVDECVSGFANTNATGGLVILGVGRDGLVEGTRHLTEAQRNDLVAISNRLRNHAAVVREVECTNRHGEPDAIVLVYVPPSEHSICETRSERPKAWLRQGMQNLPLTEESRERLRREKRVVDFELAYCTPFDSSELDRGVVEQFSESHYPTRPDRVTTEDLLYHAGAVTKSDGLLGFTNAGFLYFASNPQRVLTAANVRLLRFEVPFSQREQRGLPTFDRTFSGPITKQIRDLREFFEGSGFFRTFQRRHPDGGFVQEPELPFITVDEGIVNAVAHRDYGVTLPIEIEKYTDALVVRSPGRLRQREGDVPPTFSLENTNLVSAPRNPKLMEWLRAMRDAKGAEFVRAISEGTRRMRDEMARWGLPAPEYHITEAQTTLVLHSLAPQREAAAHADSVAEPIEVANLYRLDSVVDTALLHRDAARARRRSILLALRDALQARGWFIDGLRHGRLTAHRRGTRYPLPLDVDGVVQLLPAYCFQVYEYWGREYLAVDYSLIVQSVLFLPHALRSFDASQLIGLPATVQVDGWQAGRIASLMSGEVAKIVLYDSRQEVDVPATKVIPNLPRRMIEHELHARGITFDLARQIKRASLASDENASRARLERTQKVARELADEVFPLQVDGVTLRLLAKPAPLVRGRPSEGELRVASVGEPAVEFSRRYESSDIRDGITRAGAYESEAREIELVPVCLAGYRDAMEQLIVRLQRGAYKYHGAERTFRSRLHYAGISEVPDAKALERECARLMAQKAPRERSREIDVLFLVHTPEAGFELDDETAPYYRIKRMLLEAGLPCQMVDTPTLNNPDWKDLNLALNIAAKCGITPWVLPESIPDADFFVGLSYTQSKRAGGERLMGFANVFNQFGKWSFYSGGGDTFAYKDRAEGFAALARRTLERLPLSETPHVYFHYSAKFSHVDRAAILREARAVRPKGIYSFVCINTHHNVRLYDTRSDTNGSLARGSYVATAQGQILLSTTGANPYRRSQGTPQMLEVSLRREGPIGAPPARPDLRALAAQILSLTKLNWASTDSLCAEPITTKYASDIARLTAAFLRQGSAFRLHPALEHTPWFI